MNSIEIKYYPFPLIPWQVTAKGIHPEQWDEVTAPQLIAIARNLKGETNNLRFLQCMTGINKRLLKKLGAFRLYKINELLNFIAEKNTHNTFILDKITIAGRSFYAPQPKLKKMSFGQFIFADTHFGNWQNGHEPTEAARFLAALYLPADTRFTEDLIEKNMHMFAKTDAVTLEAVSINYQLIKEWLIHIYPLVFQHDNSASSTSSTLPLEKGEYPQGEGVNDETHTANPKKPHDPMAWVKIFETLVGDDLIHQDRWANMAVHNILRYMSRKIKESLKRKK